MADKKMKRFLIIFIILAFNCISAFAQPYTMPSSGTATYMTCSGDFYDAGGPTGNYPTNQDVIATFYPSTNGAKLSVTFTSFHTSDLLEVYNGDNISPENKIGNLFGQSAYGTITSTAANGSLTFHFVSNDLIQGNESGWEATISCNPDPPNDITMIASGSFTTCGGNFYDGGGPSGNYMTNQNTVVTLSPTLGSGAKISVTFTSFHTSDVLEVYNGDNTSPENKIGNLFGQAAYGTITSTAANGSLTFHFVSNNLIQGNESGWEATISCSPDPPNDITMITSGSFTTCGGNFYDGGGPSGDYMTGQNTVVTLKPLTPGAKISVSFTSFQTSSDVLTIYDGNSINATPIITLSGNINPGIFVSSANDGSLTFQFISDYLTQGFEVGWAATISCTGGSTTFSINTSATQIPPWQRAEDDFSGHIDVNNPSNSLWHLEVDVHDTNGNYLFPIIYPSANGLYQNFNTQSDPQLVSAATHGRQFKYYAVLDAGNQPFYAGAQNIIEKKWDRKNVIFYNSATNQLLIPLLYFPNTISTTISFSRVNGTSSYTNNILNVPSVQLGNDEYFAIDYSNSLIQSVKAGTFNYTVNYNPSTFYSESGVFDLSKIGNINNTNSGNDNIVVLVGGSLDIESAIQSLPNQSNFSSLLSWSIADNISIDYGKNTWYIATPNLNPLQKNAYNLGIALEEIRNRCINAGAVSPNISVVAHSKGGLEMRMMLDRKGAPNSSPDNFTLNPANPFSNVSINNSIHAVIFIGTPHNGVETGFQENSIAPFIYINDEINEPQIKNYFLNGTSVPNNIRIANVAAYRKCKLSDGAVDLSSSDNFIINGASSIKRFFVKSVPMQETEVEPADVFSTFCELGGCSSFLAFAVTPPPFTGLATLSVPCEAACIVNTYWDFFQALFSPIVWNEAFHHNYFTSSYVLKDPQVTCLAYNNSSAFGILNKIMSVVNNTSVDNCISPLTQNCQSAWVQLISSALQNATVSKKNLDSTYSIIAKSGENGILQLPLDGHLSLGDSLKIEAPGVETIFIAIDSVLLINGKAKISFIKSATPTSKIKHPSFTLVGQNPITNSSSLQINVLAENAIGYKILTNNDTTFVPLTLNNNIATFQLDTGSNLFAVKFIGLIDTVTISREVWYLPDTILLSFAYPIYLGATNNTLGTKIYDEKNNNQFIKELNSSSDTISLLKQKNSLRFIRFGYKDTTLIVDSTININLATILIPVNYSSMTDSSIINFSAHEKVQYYKNITVMDSARRSIISVKQFDDDFPGKELIPKSRKFEFRHLNSPNWSNIKSAFVLDQIENLSVDSIYLLKVSNDTSFIKIAFDSDGLVAGYDSLVQKLNYNYINFNNGTVAKQALVIMKKQAPIVRNVSALSVNQNDSLLIPLSQFFSDPDSIHNDMTFLIPNPDPTGLHLSIINGNLKVNPNFCYSGNSSFSIQATHDGLVRSNTVNIAVNPLLVQPIAITGNNNVVLTQISTYSINTLANATGYNWQLSGGGTIQSGQNSTSVTVYWTTVGNYTLSVNGVGVCGNGPIKNLDIAVTYGVTAVVNPDNQYQVKVVPNPSTGEFYLTAKGVINKKIRIDIFDNLGQSVYQSEQSAPLNDFNKLINLKKMADGVYYIRLTIENKTYMRKIIKAG